MNNIKLEVGKTYRMRCGRKVESLSRNEGINRLNYPFEGYIKSNGLRYTFKENGMYLDNGRDKNDIIAEWEEVPSEINMNESILQEADNVNHPSHYTAGNVECIDALESATANLSGIEAFCTGNAMKYLWRWKQKNGFEDLKKAQWYINRMLEKETV